jgi:hypothetical protein
MFPLTAHHLPFLTRQFAGSHSIMTNTSVCPSDTYAKPRVAEFLNTISARQLRWLFWVLCLVLGFLQAWSDRMLLRSDAVSYVDLGSFIWHGHLSMAVNGLWNPLYPAILGVTVGLFRPSYYWEYPLIHLLLLVLFLFAMYCFDFFLQQLIYFRVEGVSANDGPAPVGPWMCIGYVLFLWSSLRVIRVSQTNPDMLVAAFFYLACGLLVAIRRRISGLCGYLSLGLALGLGYLTKSIMFPVSIFCLGVAFVISSPARRRFVFASIGMFVLVAGPYIVALSLAKHRFTFGDSGAYNYAVHVNGVPQFHWTEDSTTGMDLGHPVHSSRQILNSPATFEFGSPIAGTYPPWTDPTYWHEGVRARFAWRQILATERNLLGQEAFLLLGVHGSLAACILLTLYMSGRRWSVLEDLSRHWFLLVPSLAVLVMYAAVHVEPRYLAPFLTVCFLSVFLGVRMSLTAESGRLYYGIAFVMLVMFFEPFQSPSLELRSFLHDVLRGPAVDPNSPAEVLNGLLHLGLKPGDRVAALQRSDFGMSDWACLAGVRIVAEVNYWPDLPNSDANNFWNVDVATQDRVIRSLASTGARYIVSELPPPGVAPPGWIRVGHSQYYAYRIDAAASPTA